MNEVSAEEIWQVEVNGVVYEAPFAELTQWIAEGALKPGDKVRRGNLRWIEAGKVPFLYGYFNAKELGTEPPIKVPPQSNFFTDQSDNSFKSVEEFPNPVNFEHLSESEPCILHSHLEAVYFCPTCLNSFCSQCPRSIGGGYRNCPMCGARCESIAKVRQEIQEAQNFETLMNEGFGFLDFGRALAYPFKFKLSLLFGAVLYMFFSVGQHASALGGRWLISAAILSGMLANMLTFGILANTVENFLQYKLNQNFMPSFDDFSLWDDTIQPFFLSIGVYLSAFLPLITLTVIMVFMVAGSIKNDSALKDGAVPVFAPEIMPNYEGAKQGKEQIDFVKQSLKLREEHLKRRQEAVEQESENGTGFNQLNQNYESNTNSANLPLSIPAYNEEKEFEQLNEMINKTRKQQLESSIGKEEVEDNVGLGGLWQTITTWGGPFLVLALIFGGWGLIYLPVAFIVAAYTRNFVSVLNPMIGLDTIKRLGFDYVKILLMGFILIIFNWLVNILLSLLLSPFDLPRLGNIPVVAIASLFSFYLSIVFSLVLGYALFKNSSKFQLFQSF